MSVLGVITRRPFPGESTPALAGIGHAAHLAGWVLLLCSDLDFVDALHTAMSGCVLLDHTAGDHNVARLAAHAIPFVSIGRRDGVNGPVPYVDVDHAAGVRDLVARAAARTTPSRWNASGVSTPPPRLCAWMVFTHRRSGWINCCGPVSQL